MGIQRIFHRTLKRKEQIDPWNKGKSGRVHYRKSKGFVEIIPDPGRHVHPRRKRKPKYVAQAEARRKEHRKLRRKAS